VKNILWLFSILLLFVSAAIAQTQNVPADIVARLRDQARMTFVKTQIPHNEEYVAAVLSNGSVIYTMVSNRGGKFSRPPGIMLLLHTHPYGSHREPSDRDKATANKIAAPNCVVTATEVECALPEGKIVPGRIVREATVEAYNTKPRPRAMSTPVAGLGTCGSADRCF